MILDFLSFPGRKYQTILQVEPLTDEVKTLGHATRAFPNIPNLPTRICGNPHLNPCDECVFDMKALVCECLGDPNLFSRGTLQNREDGNGYGRWAEQMNIFPLSLIHSWCGEDATMRQGVGCPINPH